MSYSLPSISMDTASYRLSGNNIFFHDTREYGLVFQHQTGDGIMADTTTAHIISLTPSFLQLRFPVESTIDDNGDVSYYRGWLIYSLRRE